MCGGGGGVYVCACVCVCGNVPPDERTGALPFLIMNRESELGGRATSVGCKWRLMNCVCLFVCVHLCVVCVCVRVYERLYVCVCV